MITSVNIELAELNEEELRMFRNIIKIIKLRTFGDLNDSSKTTDELAKLRSNYEHYDELSYQLKSYIEEYTRTHSKVFYSSNSDAVSIL